MTKKNRTTSRRQSTIARKNASSNETAASARQNRPTNVERPLTGYTVKRIPASLTLPERPAQVARLLSRQGPLEAAQIAAKLKVTTNAIAGALYVLRKADVLKTIH